MPALRMVGRAKGVMHVIIVNHNTRDLLAECLVSLEGGGLDDVDATVWVVDNASSDGSAAMVMQRFPWVRLEVSRANLGFSAANNRALRASGDFDRRPASAWHSRSASPGSSWSDGRETGERGDGADRGDGPAGDAGESTRRNDPPHVLLLNPDTVVPAGALARLASVLDVETDVGVVGPQLILPDGSLDLACRRAFPTPEVAFYRFSGLSRLMPRSPRFGRYNMTFLDRDEPADVDAVVGACMLVRGAAVADVGLLDERFWMYGEDLDWCLRIRRAGWRVVYRPHVVVHHVKRAASRGSRRASYEFQRAMWLFYQKHYRADTAAWVDLLVRAGLMARGGRRLMREMTAERGADDRSVAPDGGIASGQDAGAPTGTARDPAPGPSRGRNR